MLRNRAVALFLTCTASSLAFALGLGPLKSDSSLNEPFAGRIDILGAVPEDFDTLTVSLADAEQFRRAGIERPPVLYGLRFAIDDSVPGEDFIRITSKDPIREPYLNFLVELNWANGRLVREYTVLLDPPLYDPERRRSVTAAPAAPAPATPAASTQTAPAVAPAAAAPTFAAPATAPGYAAGRELPPVMANDTLWSIATRTRPQDGTTVQQMMLALLRSNPQAFGEDNVNLLRRGAVLRLPSLEEINRLDARAAFAEIKRHNQLWQGYRDQVAAAPETQPVGAPAPSTPFDFDEPVDDDARLELVAPGAAEGGAAPGAAGAGGAELLREEVEARAQQAAELESKLAEAEGIIDLLQRQVNIKDEELAALQARLAELGVEAPQPEVTDDIDELVVDTEDTLAGLDEDPFEIDTDAADEGEDVVAEDTTEPAPSETPAPVPAAEPAAETPAKPAAAAKPAKPAKPAASPPARSFPANLVPEHIAALVPGGSLTVLGAAALLVLGIVIGLVTGVMRRRGRAAEPTAAAPAAASATAATTLPPETTEAPDSEAPTELGAAAELETQPAFDPNATVEAESDQEVPDEFMRTQVDVQRPEAQAEEDPLEEVNVYLAYERFDQAEELVKRVIEQYPDRHEYKLRLLEVYYSSNDHAAYENAARELRDAVGEDDPLWASALAMWAEMSPERALFAEGAAESAAPSAESGSAFVDITAEMGGEGPTESTLVQAPGEPDAEPETRDEDAGLDFDLTGNGDDAEPVFDLTGSADEAEPVFDITATADDEEALDLTASAGGEDEVLDLTAGDDTAGDEIFDLTGGEQDTDEGEDVLDLTGGDTTPPSEPSSASVHNLDSLADTHDPATDLLDVTSAGDTSGLDDDSPLELGGKTAEDSSDDELLDFDISDTAAPVFGADDEIGDHEELLDLGGGEGDADLLDFDIGGFDDQSATNGGFDVESTGDLAGSDAPGEDIADTLDFGAPPSAVAGEKATDESDLDLDLTRGMDDTTGRFDVTESEGDDGSLEITMGAPDSTPLDGELSLQGDELDELSLGGEDEFDLSLENTSDMDSIAAEETMEMGSARLGALEGDEDLGGFELDLSLPGEEADNAAEAPSAGHFETLELSTDAGFDADAEEHGTVRLPQGADIARQSAADEADTKLNLAKAYIELGDNEGARSILAEVVSDGTDAQKVEAQTLLDQIAE